MRITLQLGLAAMLFAGLTSSGPKAAMVGHGGDVKQVAISPDGGRALSASFDYSLILWDVQRQSQIRQFLDHNGAVNAAVFLPDGRRALSVSDDATMALWDTETGARLHSFEGHQGRVVAVAI